MKLFITETINKTKVIINPKSVSFLQQNTNLGWIMVTFSGAAHNLSGVETERLIKMMEELED